MIYVSRVNIWDHISIKAMWIYPAAENPFYVSYDDKLDNN